MLTTRLSANLLHVDPPVTRVIDVPAGITLSELHGVLQAAFGWTDSHLHEWHVDDVNYTAMDDDVDEDDLDEAGVELGDLPARFTYEYDFGDSWEHVVDVIGPGGEAPGLVSGVGTCPPEDCGGPAGYDELRAVLADPLHPDHEDMLACAGPLLPYDANATERAVHTVLQGFG